MKKFIGYIMIILLFCGSICGIVFGIQLMKTNKKIDNLYTQEEVEYKYQQYIDQISEKNVVIDDLNNQLTILTTENTQQKADISNLQNSISEKDSQIETLTSEKTTLTGQIETLNSQITELNSQIETLSEDKENNLAQIEELQSEKSALETQVSTLTASVNEKEQTIQTLTADKTELEEEISILTATISENETTISSLNSQISNLNLEILTLQNEITRLEGLLAGYEDIVNETYSVDFYVDDLLFSTKVAKRGEKVSPPDSPTKNFYSFIGWSLDKVDIVDLTSYTINDNTILYAMFTSNLNENTIVSKFEQETKQANLEVKYFSFVDKVLFVANENYAYSLNFSEGNIVDLDDLVNYISSDTYVEWISIEVALSDIIASYASNYNNFLSSYASSHDIDHVNVYLNNLDVHISEKYSTKYEINPNALYFGFNSSEDNKASFVDMRIEKTVRVKTTNEYDVQEMCACSLFGLAFASRYNYEIVGTNSSISYWNNNELFNIVN